MTSIEEFKRTLDHITKVSSEHFYKVGSTTFDQFIPVAIKSSIPLIFYQAYYQQRSKVEPQIQGGLASGKLSDYEPQLAFTLFGKEFDNTHLEATYALTFALAVASTKKWQEQNKTFEELKSLLDNYLAPILLLSRLTREKLINSLLEIHEIEIVTPSIVGVIKKMNQAAEINTAVKHDAIESYGMMIVLQEQTKPHSLIQKLAEQGSILFGSQSSSKRFSHVRNYLEEYFTNPRVQNKMVLLAQPSRIISSLYQTL